MRRIRAVASAVALLVCVAAQAAAAPCEGRATLLLRLERLYGESVRFRALDARGALVEILVSVADAGGRVTWSLVRTLPGGPACLLLAGEEFEAVEAPPPTDGA